MKKRKFKKGDSVIIWYTEDWSRRDLQGKEAVVISGYGDIYHVSIPGVAKDHAIRTYNLLPGLNGIERARKIIKENRSRS